MNSSYKFDAMHTTVMWKCSHFGFSTPYGLFSMIDGELTFDENNISASKVSIVININNLSTGIAKFEEHLKSKDFFNVAEHKYATFKSSSVAILDKNHLKVTGVLTLLGIGHEINLIAVINKIDTNPMTSNKTIGFSANAKINRSDYGMVSFLPGIADEVILTIEAEAFKQNIV